MKAFLLTALFLYLLPVSLHAQIPAVKGVVSDTTTNRHLVNTTITVLHAKDSTLVKFTRVNENGAFSLTGLKPGNFILLVTYPGYADYVEPFKLDSSQKSKDFGHIKLMLKATLLANVIIKGTAVAIKIKGDTTEYNASAYHIEPNSKVEDLLKQLPGIQVDKDGKITAQGKTVSKVLVDGEEFFGDDPTLVTKNIRGDMVDKVQLFDKKSDQAAFTGIDDGKKEKTINITLKEDKKNGYFGKIDGGKATDGYYQGQAMFNAFKGKKKFSAYGTLANTGKVGLGWEDNSKYGSAGDIEFSDGVAFIVNTNDNDGLDSYNGNYDGAGLPVTRNGALHYDAKWNSDKESVNANYKIGSINVEGTRNNLSQNNLPSGIINSSSDEDFDNYMFRQKLDAVYQIKLDSTANLKISADGTIKNSETNSNYRSRTLRDNSVLLNENTRELSNDSHDKQFNVKLFCSKKLKKKGRTLSVSANGSNNRSSSDGFLKSTTTYYDDGNTRDSLINQYKTSEIRSASFNANLAYTEPLSKSLSLILNYGIMTSSNKADRKSFNQSDAGGYTLLDTLYSNNYKLDQLANQGGAILNFIKNKSTVRFGTKISTVRFEQLNSYRNTGFKRNFTNWNPQASFNYKFSQYKWVRIDYNGNTSQPSIDQINPVRINTDPLNISLGNPNLKPSFDNRISLNYNSYKVISGHSMWIGGSYGFTGQAIVSNTMTDTAGKSIYQSINLNGKKPTNYYFYVDLNWKIKSLDMSTGLSVNSNGNTSYSYINGSLNKSTSSSYIGNIYFLKYKEKKYEGRISFGPTYKTNETSLQKDINDNGWGLNSNASVGLYLPFKIEIATDANYEYRAKTQSFNSDFKRLLWNARLNKKFLKSEGLKLSLSVNDLLNQNKGFERNAYNNMIIQNSYTTIKRYFMASIIWDFNKMGGDTAKK